MELHFLLLFLHKLLNHIQHAQPPEVGWRIIGGALRAPLYVHDKIHTAAAEAAAPAAAPAAALAAAPAADPWIHGSIFDLF